jgi:predicted ATPase
MAQHPFLKSIRPVNLLSFGPNTKEIELGPLNILIGPNGSGKSNFIEIVRLLSCLPDKEPWATVIQTGGVDEWVWQGRNGRTLDSRVSARAFLEWMPLGASQVDIRACDYSITVAKSHSSFYVKNESCARISVSKTDGKLTTSFESSGSTGVLSSRQSLSNFTQDLTIQLNPERSVLSQRTSRSIQESLIGKFMPELFELAEFFEGFDFHQDWEFGADLTPRDPIPVGQSVKRLEENGYNLAQMLAFFRDYHRPEFERINELMKKFYEPFESLDVRLIGTHLQPAINEEGGISVSAYRLSDGTLRWLALLVILLNPDPAPVTCIEEPELGLHPDAIHTLADLLVEASTRTQLIVTTHSDALLDAFTETPEVVCVCEKVEGSTVIRRLDKERLKVWLKDYSLGHLWMSGEIGGNRW